MLVLAFVIIACWLYYRSHCQFNAEDWKVARGRTYMVSSIINTGLLENKSLEEVMNILGKPSYYEEPQPHLGVGLLGQKRLDYPTGKTRLMAYESLMVIVERDTVVSIYATYRSSSWGL